MILQSHSCVCVCVHTHTHTHTHTVEYYSAIKKERIRFAATWMDLEIITLNEASQQISYDIAYM